MTPQDYDTLSWTALFLAYLCLIAMGTVIFPVIYFPEYVIKLLEQGFVFHRNFTVFIWMSLVFISFRMWFDYKKNRITSSH
jgi:uncharacterized membrane protein